MSAPRNFNKLQHDRKRGESQPEEWDGTYTPGQLWRKGGRNHEDIFVELKKNPYHQVEKKWNNEHLWSKERIMEWMKNKFPGAYYIAVYNKPRNSRITDLYWKNPEWKEDIKITKLPKGNIYQGYHEGNYGQPIK